MLDIFGFRRNETHRKKAHQRPVKTNLVQLEKNLSPVVQRLSETPEALDILCDILNRALDGTKNNRQPFASRISKTAPAFPRTLGKSGYWAERFLEHMKYKATDTAILLDKRNFNREILLTGLSKLEKAKENEQYQYAKEKLQFNKEMKLLLQDESSVEMAQRKRYLEALPMSPPDGAPGTTRIKVYFGEEIISRVFSSDHTLSSVLHWICSSFHSSLLSKLRSKKLELINLTATPKQEVSISNSRASVGSDGFVELDLLEMLDKVTLEVKSEDKTLQTLGWWPSAELELQPFGFLMREKQLIGINTAKELDKNNFIGES